MSYSSNPLLPKARKWAINLVLVDGLSPVAAARRAGVHRTTLWRWLKRWQELGLHGNSYLPTRSSRPRHFGRVVSLSVVERIRHFRQKYGRCAEVIHAYCAREGTVVSLSTVRRILHRLGLVARKKWRRYRAPAPRPKADAPGMLVQTDTVHLASRARGYQRTYLYTLVDVYSRWAYSEYHPVLSQDIAADVIRRGEIYAGFHFQTVQADNGPEFGRHFEQRLKEWDMVVRHSRVRRPNDNAHIERFNRTIQEECVGSANPFSEELYGKVLTYLAYYNGERLHLGIQCQTPDEMLQRF